MVMLGVLMISCSNNPNSNSDGQRLSSIEKETPAKELFSNKCAVCHGNDGTAGISGAANLQTSQLNVDTIRQRIMDGKKNMPAFKEVLTPAQTQRLSEYVKTLHKK